MKASLVMLAVLLSSVGGIAPRASAQDSPITARLTASSEVLTIGDSFSVTLEVEVAKDTMLPATLFGGYDLRTWVDGQPSVALERAVPGEVAVAAGTVLRREVPVDVAVTWEESQLEGHKELELAWDGLEGARTSLRLVPNQKSLDLDTLDAAKAKVRLVTSMGDIVVTLRPDKAPNHVRNFLKLSKDGFYNGTRFHRIIRGFMIQGGDPNTRTGATGTYGSGGPGYTIDAEFNDLKHVRGVLSMARMPDPNSAGSQFFLMHGKSPSLDGKYTAFGAIETGLETLDAIADTPVRRHPSSGQASVPVDPVWLYAAIVEPAKD